MPSTVLYEPWQASTVPAGRWLVSNVGDATSTCSNGKLRIATGTSAFNSSTTELLGKPIPADFEFYTEVTMPAALGGSGWMASFRGESIKNTWTIAGSYQLRWATDNFLTLFDIDYAGGETVLTAATVTGATNATFGFRVRMVSNRILCWMWNKTGAEPMVPTIEWFHDFYKGGRFLISAYTSDTTTENWDFGPIWFTSLKPRDDN